MELIVDTNVLIAVRSQAPGDRQVIRHWKKRRRSSCANQVGAPSSCALGMLAKRGLRRAQAPRLPRPSASGSSPGALSRSEVRPLHPISFYPFLTPPRLNGMAVFMPAKRLVSTVSRERILQSILLIRGHRVILDADLAELYGVPTKVLNQAVSRNADRFPSDFMFRVIPQEAAIMRSQFVTASKRNIRFRPFVFTEHGALMAAMVLNSPRAVDMSVPRQNAAQSDSMPSFRLVLA